MSRALQVAAVVIGLFAGAAGSQAAEVKVLTAGVMKEVVLAVVPGVRESEPATRRSCRTIPPARSTGDRGRRSVRSCHSDACRIKALAAKTNLPPVVPTWPGWVWVVVKAGAPVPDIFDREAFKKRRCSPPNRLPTSIRRPEARAASMWRACSDRLGIAPRISRKAKLKKGGYVRPIWFSER